MFFFSLLLCATPLFNAGTAPLELGSAPSARACGSCHIEEAADWETSAHHRAGTNRRYEVAITAGPSPWCKNCHEPVQAAEGVNCAVCHVRNEVVLANKKPSAAAREAHAIRQEPLMATADFCAGCHEFHFPTRMQIPVANHVTPSTELVQSVVSEWRQSHAAANGDTCQSCHMPQGSHRFATHRNKHTLAVEVLRKTPELIEARIAVTDIGHAFPTGDPFRRVLFELCGDAQCQVVHARYSLGRDNAPRGERFTFVADTRIKPCADRTCESVLTFTTKAPATHWRLRYFFADPRNEAKLPIELRERLLASGVIR